MKKLVSAINKASGEASLKDDLLNKTFEKWWPDFEAKLKALKTQEPTSLAAVEKAEPEDVLEKVLEIARINQRILNSPEQLVPPQYLSEIIREALRNVKPEKSQRLLRMANFHFDRIEEMNRRLSIIFDKGAANIDPEDVAMAQRILSETQSRMEDLRHFLFRSGESF